MKKVLLITVITVLCVELVTRLYCALEYKSAIHDSPKEIIYRVIYPVLRENNTKTTKDDGYFDILILGSSTMEMHYNVIGRLITEKLWFKGIKTRVFNLSMAGQTSLDQYYKYKSLENRYDLILYYDAINDLRANNAPASEFSQDYRHYSVYRVLHDLEKPRIFVTPLLIQLMIQKPIEKLGWLGLVPTDKPIKGWEKHGSDIKTKWPYHRNLKRIAEIANERGEKLVLITFAYYENEDYSCNQYYGYPVSMWGLKENVVAGLKVHHEMIRKVA